MFGKTAIIIALIASGMISVSLMIYAQTRRKVDGANAFVALMAAMTFYSLGYAFELVQTDIRGMLLAIRIEYIGLSVLPAFWILVALKFLGQHRYLAKGTYVLLFAIPVITLILLYTNEWHGFFYRKVGVNVDAPFPVALISGGAWYYVQVGFNTVALIVGSAIYLRSMIRAPGVYRNQAIIMFIASLAPFVGSAIYHLGFAPYGLDMVPITTAIAGPLIALALFRYGLYDLTPIAREIVFERMRDPVVVIDSLSRLVDFNPAATTLFPQLQPLSIGKNITELFHENDPLLMLLSSSVDSSEDISVQGRTDLRYFRSTVTRINDKVGHQGAVLNLYDITDSKRAFDELHTMATVDGLTGLYNRRNFEHLVRLELDRALRYDRPYSMVLLDLDHFKQVNDTYGHAAGDKVLQSVAQVLRDGVRNNDILARHGGEEFIIFLPETAPADAGVIAERLRENLEHNVVPHEIKSIVVTSSFGIFGRERAHDDDFEFLVSAADRALYRAKDNGRNCVVIGEPEAE